MFWLLYTALRAAPAASAGTCATWPLRVMKRGTVVAGIMLATYFALRHVVPLVCVSIVTLKTARKDPGVAGLINRSMTMAFFYYLFQV